MRQSAAFTLEGTVVYSLDIANNDDVGPNEH